MSQQRHDNHKIRMEIGGYYLDDDDEIQHQEPLVLDPARPISQQQTPPQEGMVQKFLQAATSKPTTRFIKQRKQDTTEQQQQDDDEVYIDSYYYTAAKWAQDPTCVVYAGYLLKLGTRIVEFKRRFFVLTRPISYLYYFLSPQDVEPRGCINLQNCKVQKDEAGNNRIHVTLSNSNQVIVLEARNQQIQEEWFEALQNNHEACLEELRMAKDTQEEQSQTIQTLQETIRELTSKQQTAESRASACETKLQHLEQGIRLLTRHVTVQKDDESAEQKDTEQEEEEPEERSDEDEDDSSLVNGVNQSQASRENALLDSADEDSTRTPEEDLLTVMDQTPFPGSFSSLYCACNQLKQFANLSANEASTAVHDLHQAHATLQKLQKRMTKAEQYLFQLWQDNCNQRKSLKKLKQEKKVLVKEIKNSLMMVSNSSNQNRTTTTNSSSAERNTTNEATTQTTAAEDEQLLNELEEHVMTSIKLHEELLLVGGGNNTPNFVRDSFSSSSQPAVIASLMDNIDDDDGSMESNDDDDENSMAPSLVSFVQGGKCAQESKDDGETANGQEAGLDTIESDTVRHFEGADQARATEEKDLSSNDDESATVNVNLNRSAADETPEPTLRLSQHDVSKEDDDDDSTETEEENPLVALDATEDEQDVPAVPTRQSLVTQNGRATSRLISPLADVVVVDGRRQEGESVETTSNKDDGRVYHLLFYSRKIGIQFQKVPIPQNNSTTKTGLLTHAMTSDLGPAVIVNGQEKTASELQRIAAISRLATDKEDGSNDFEQQQHCPVVGPVDAVLVCGLVGFDHSANPTTCCRRPKLGSRLVAFDGVSLEVGRWTFESVRKAIQARGRPLTLSFRDDMLTTHQREILTRAIVDIKGRTPTREQHYHHLTPPPSIPRPPSSDSEPRILVGSSGRIHEVVGRDDADDQSSVSTMASVSIASDRQSVGGGDRGVPSRRSPYSFSEAGSSSIVSAALVGPLMANLMSNLSLTPSNGQSSTSNVPNYLLSDAAESIENKAQHRQFEESLL